MDVSRKGERVDYFFLFHREIHHSGPRPRIEKNRGELGTGYLIKGIEEKKKKSER